MALCVGIDVAKHALEWNVGGEEKVQHARNEPRPIAQLVRQLVALDPARIIVESTGGYERTLVTKLAEAGLPVVVVNPRRVRSFGQALGILAKTEDPLAQFDLGYAVDAYRQTRHMLDRLLSGDPPGDGCALVRRALSARGPDPEMEYGAALVTYGRAARGISDKHLKLAVAGAREGSDLERTLTAHQHLWGDRVQAFRTALAR